MKYLYFLLLITLCYSCNYSSQDHTPVQKKLKRNDYWINNYDQLNINKTSIKFSNNKLYCSTYSGYLHSDSSIFYCLDLPSGKVLWANNVRAWEDYQPIILNDVIYYTTYVGERYAYDTSGNQIWYYRPPTNLSFKAQTYNTINHNLIMSDVVNGFYEFDKVTGKEISFTAPCDTCLSQTTLPVFIDNYMYFANYVDTIERPEMPEIPYNSLICQDYKTKRAIWIKPFKYVNRLYVKDNNICFTDTGFAYSVNGKTGKLNWQIKLTKENRTKVTNFFYQKKSRVLIYLYKYYEVKVKIGSAMGNNDYNENTELSILRR